MLLWFVIVAPVIVAEVFRSPMVDYRLVALGALLPMAEVLVGGRLFVLHTLAAAVGALGLVMAATVGRRLLRRRLLGVPIGLFLHLALDGTWSVQQLFWWPAFGLSPDRHLVPGVGRSPLVFLVLEVAAVAVGWWAWQRYDLADADNRRLLRSRGHLARSVMVTP